jgi:hypothetical protein
MRLCHAEYVLQHNVLRANMLHVVKAGAGRKLATRRNIFAKS